MDLIDKAGEVAGDVADKISDTVSGVFEGIKETTNKNELELSSFFLL
ncbi:hypothetical protein [Streptococcus suis]|nr:hypothetical protein [Streptococcus suis]MCQ9275901.1 hypothetical protein [Streptococcus suis]NQM30840.1 hypothetical protein [Streptococcus suis]HEL1797343.1 hypothetical protein [Streptococcus suis]